MRVKIWGSRGSLPAPLEPEAVENLVRQTLKEFLAQGFSKESQIESFCAQLPRHLLGGFGGNTPCIDILSGPDRVILDGGSGIRKLGYELMAGPCGKGAGEAHIFFTHFHWDHLIGLPFFTPIFIPGNTLHVYSVQPNLKGVFEILFKKPYFPVPLEGLGAKIVYHQLEPRKPVKVGKIQLTPYQLDHPDPCWGYKVESDGKVYSHCVDTECKRGSRDELGADLPLYQGVDLMTFDAQYTLMETLEKIDWGHATAPLGLDIAIRENIKRVLFMHHDPASSSEKVALAESQARRYYDSRIKSARQAGQPAYEVEWSFAYDGLTVEL